MQRKSSKAELCQTSLRLSRWTSSEQQIQEETVNEYLDRTVSVGETLAETQARRRAFLDGMNAGAFLLMPGGVSRAAACDGNWYSIGYNYNTLPGTLPMN